MKEKNIQENDDTKPVILQTAFKNLSSTFWMKHKDATRELTETISKGKEDNMHVVTIHKDLYIGLSLLLRLRSILGNPPNFHYLSHKHSSIVTQPLMAPPK